MAAGWWSSLFIDSSGTLWAWGSSRDGALGVKARWIEEPIQILPAVRRIEAGNNVVFAIKPDGSLWTWGFWGYQRGDRFQETRTSPRKLLNKVKLVSTSQHHSLALREDGVLMLKKDGTVWEWGTRGGSFLYPPTQVMSDVQEIAAGESHFLVLKKDGTVWSWGINDAGQLGDGSKEDRREPRQVAFPQ